MNFDFPQVDLPCPILAWTDVTEEILNLYKQTCRLKAGIFAVCWEGKMTATINLIDYEIKPNDLITLLPGSIIQFREKTEKIRLCFIGYSRESIDRINLIQSISGSYAKIVECPIVALNEATAEYMKDYISLLTKVTCNEEMELTPEMTEGSLKCILLGVEQIYKKHPWNGHSITRKEEICRELVSLVAKHYLAERRAQFYANQLGISLQHLSTTVKQVTGKNVLDIIAYIVIMDAKSKLKSTHMTIQEVAYSLNFPSASFFGKYFKRYVNMSPQEYRNS